MIPATPAWSVRSFSSHCDRICDSSSQRFGRHHRRTQNVVHFRRSFASLPVRWNSASTNRPNGSIVDAEFHLTGSDAKLRRSEQHCGLRRWCRPKRCWNCHISDHMPKRKTALTGRRGGNHEILHRVLPLKGQHFIPRCSLSLPATTRLSNEVPGLPGPVCGRARPPYAAFVPSQLSAAHEGHDSA